MHHELKIKKPFADAIYYEDKNFEIRYNDRGYQKGDIIKFTAIDEVGFTIHSHPINDCEYIITYVLNGWGLKENYVAFGIKRLECN